SKERFKRILLFKFRINKFPKPFRGMVSFQKPLHKIDITEFPMEVPKWKFPQQSKEKLVGIVPEPLEDYICLVPSAAWELKRWDVAYWKELILQLHDRKFLVIGGPADDFCEEIAAVAPERAISLAGKTSLMDSCYVVHETALTISADTGFIHAADLFGKKGIFLAGPTAFGYPTGKQIAILEKEMPCRPCTKDGRGKCSQKINKECLMALTPQLVAKKVRELIE
ncbi:MAG: glycosyl transferase 9, partial [Bacteroidia bacterium]